MAGAWALKKRYVGVRYGLTLEQIEKDHGGLAMLSPTNVIELNDIETYLKELAARIEE
jgi:hypothetical protein